MRIHALAVLALLSVVPVAAQLSESMEVRVMELEATVLDRHGRLVQDLTRDAFRVEIGGREVPVSNFFVVENGVVLTEDELSKATEPTSPIPPIRESIPTNVVLFIDEVHLSTGSRKRALEALQTYVRDAFDGSMVVTVIRYSKHFDVRLRPTGRKPDVLEEIERLRREPFTDDAARDRVHMIQLMDGVLFGNSEAPDVAGESPDTIFTRLESYAEQRTADLERTISALEDAVALASAFRGRKVLLYVSDGLPQHPALELFEYWERATQLGGGGYVWRQSTARTDMARAMRFDRAPAFRRLAESAQRGDVAFYSFDAGGLRGYEGRGVDTTRTRERIDTASMHANLRSGLQYVAGETGGTYIANENNIGKALARMSEQFSSYYSIGVRPLPGEVRVSVRGRPELRVLASKRMPPRTRDDELDQNVRTRLYTRGTENPLEARLSPARASTIEGRCAVAVTLSVPQPALPPELTPRTVEVRMVMLNEQNDESPLQRFTVPFRSGRVVHPMVLRIRPQHHVLSVAVSSPTSGETSYLQSEIDGTTCRQE
ncbi:MAG: VWA domain-containing protein [Thermoanaerobaculia bacterium]